MAGWYLFLDWLGGALNLPLRLGKVLKGQHISQTAGRRLTTKPLPRSAPKKGFAHEDTLCSVSTGVLAARVLWQGFRVTVSGRPFVMGGMYPHMRSYLV
jgi:hypothetical protein